MTDTTFTIDKMFLYAEDGAPDDVELRIFNVADVNSSTLTEGTVLLENLVFSPPNKSDGDRWVLELDLTDDSEIELPATTGTAGYALQLVAELNGTEDVEWNRTDSNSIYADGRGYDAGGHLFGGARDFSLAIVAVPEPASLVLLTALTGVLGFRRRG